MISWIKYLIHRWRYLRYPIWVMDVGDDKPTMLTWEEAKRRGLEV